MSKKYLQFALVSAVVLIVGLTSVIIATLSSLQDIKSANSQASQSQVVVRSLSGKSIEADKSDVVATMSVLLNAANKYEGELSADERVMQIEVNSANLSALGDFSKVDEITSFGESDSFKVPVYQALVKISSLMKTDGSNQIVPVKDRIFTTVFLDQQAGVAYVPLSVFGDNLPPFSFEFVYVDGMWKFYPYNLLELIKFSAQIR